MLITSLRAKSYNLRIEYNPTDIDYLCGLPLGTRKVNQDHIFQDQFRKRKQPKIKGFEYGGFLWVHEECNNKFGGAGQGPESICKKALRLLEVLYSNGAIVNTDTKILGINSSLLQGFTKQDLNFFKIIDGRKVPNEELTASKYLADKQMANPFQVPSSIALSTLAKSAAGFLVKKYGFPPQGRWRILASHWHGEDEDFDFDHLFGNQKPLEVGIKLWVKPMGDNWIVAYKFNRFLACFCFESVASDLFRQVKGISRNTDWMFFDSDKLIDLVGYDWSNNEYPL
ncbi:MAG: hypothetical protein HY033_09340 [Ignavibacteriae bacterium]|nr:hypothetical protein [Ignavibacteriota bacterium]